MKPGERQPGPEAPPNFDLDPGAGLGARSSHYGMRDYHAAARFVQCLTYGRNSQRSDYGLVLVELRGTCSTKHALLAALAREHERQVELRLGVYEMDGDNTPGVGPVLRSHGLDNVPEAHCYLAFDGERVDLILADPTEPVEDFLHEETIESEGIGAYKVGTHRRFVREWAYQRTLNFEQAWWIREKCILALSERDRTQGRKERGDERTRDKSSGDPDVLYPE